MKSEYRKGLEDGLKVLERVLEAMSQEGMDLDNAYEILRDEKNLAQES